MALDYDHMMSLKSENQAFSYSGRETMLYALGVGMGRKPLDERELNFVYEKDLKTIPTMSSVIAWGAGRLNESGINYMMVVHGEQSLTMHQPLPPMADILADSRVTGVYDKGKDKGAIITTETVVKLASGEKLCTMGSTTFARGDGGFGGSPDGAPKPHALPNRAPDRQISAETKDDQALLYRLSGDRNPLHIDPEVAKMAGFPKPILHGLCSYGSACRAILTEVCNYDHAKIKEFNVRFSAPVFPGETLLLDLWEDADVLSFRARVKERDGVTALNNGKCLLG